MEQIRYLDSKGFKKFITTEAAKQNKSVNKFIQDNLRKVLKKPLDFKKQKLCTLHKNLKQK